MAFANLLMLFGLAAVVIPVVLHIARRERPVPTDLPTVEFVRRAINRTQRRRRLQDWLLLAVRILLMVLAALFFSRPSWRANPFARADLAQAAVAIVVDDAWYQSARTGDGQRLELVREQALAVVDRLSPGSRAALFTRSRDAGELTLDLDFVRNQIRSLEPQTAVGGLRTAVARAQSLLADQRGELPGLVVVIADPNAATLAPNAGPLTSPEDLKLTLLPLPPRPADAWLGPIQQPQNLHPVPNRPYPITVTVGGDALPTGARIRLREDTRTVAELPVPSGPGTRSVRFDYVPTTPGNHNLHATLVADDPIPLDNHSYATITVDSPRRVVIVGAEAATVASRDLLALAAAPPGWLGRQRFAVRVTPPEQIADLSADLVILCGPRMPDATGWETLLSSRIPLLVWPDADVAPEALNRHLQPILRRPLARYQPPEPVTLPPTVEPGLPPREPVVLRTWFAPEQTTAAGSPTDAPILRGATAADAPVVFCGIPFDPTGSDLLRLRDFAPFVHRLVAAAAGRQRPSADVAVGQVARLSVPPGNHYTVHLPDSSSLPLPPPETDHLQIPHTQQPGFYEVRVDDVVAAAFAADLPRPPGLHQTLDAGQLAALLPEAAQLTTDPVAVAIPGKAGRRPLELAPALLLLFLLLLPFEGALTAAKYPPGDASAAP